MVKGSKGFFSIDALFAVTMLLMVTASFLNVYQGRKASAEAVGSGLEARMIGEKLASSIDAVYANGPNFSLKIELPENIGSYPYSISFDNTTRLISIENSFWQPVRVPVLCKNVKNFTLDRENLGRQILVSWEGSQLRVVS